MNKRVFAILAIVLVFAGCSKSKNEGCGLTEAQVTASASEIAVIQAYLTANSLTATQHSSGLFYTIVTAGTGTTTPAICSSITVKYTGRFLNGTIFDNNNNNVVPAQFLLGRLIPGWQKAIPLIKKGGSIKLYIPPSLGYGSQDVKNNAGVVVIPGNSTLIFDMDLLDVQ
jgi:FKBP-type peptidyl-prolyl cis-trans isomerase FkpA